MDLLPISLIIPKYIQSIPKRTALCSLFDSGIVVTLLHEPELPHRIIPTQTSCLIKFMW
jgi:hypothetical protein